jgi:hypothetical protein
MNKRQLYYQANKEQIKAKQNEWRAKNPDLVYASKVYFRAKYQNELHDVYIKEVLVNRKGYKRSEITPELIEIQRNIIKLSRYVKRTK